VTALPPMGYNKCTNLLQIFYVVRLSRENATFARVQRMADAKLLPLHKTDFYADFVPFKETVPSDAKFMPIRLRIRISLWQLRDVGARYNY
jgi:hypothetical protein